MKSGPTIISDNFPLDKLECQYSDICKNYNPDECQYGKPCYFGIRGFYRRNVETYQEKNNLGLQVKLIWEEHGKK